MKHKQITLRSGEILNVPQSSEEAICPICGFRSGGDPAYDFYQSVLPDGSLSNPYGAASFETCPSCNVEYGNDDCLDGRSVASVWEVLRLAWLDRVGWKQEALRQLSENLGIDTAALKEQTKSRPSGERRSE